MRRVWREVLQGLRLIHDDHIAHGNVIYGIGMTDGGEVKLMNFESTIRDYKRQRQEDFYELHSFIRNKNDFHDKHHGKKVEDARGRREKAFVTGGEGEKAHAAGRGGEGEKAPIEGEEVAADFASALKNKKTKVGYFFMYNHPISKGFEDRKHFIEKLQDFIHIQKSESEKVIQKSEKVIHKSQKVIAQLEKSLKGTSIDEWCNPVARVRNLNNIMIHNRGTTNNNNPIFFPRFARNCWDHRKGETDWEHEKKMETQLREVFPLMYLDLHNALLELMEVMGFSDSVGKEVKDILRREEKDEDE